MKLTRLTPRFILPAAAVILLPLVTGCTAPQAVMMTGAPARGDTPSRIHMDNPGPHQIIVNAPALDANGNPLTTASGKPLRVRLHLTVGVPTGSADKSQYAVDRNPAQDESTNDGN